MMPQIARPPMYGATISTAFGSIGMASVSIA